MAPQLRFRSDVEGLRGVAVLLVVAFHLDLPLASGGFVGVDVFYVISGFLIASILARSDLSIASLGTFFNRRLWRLMPAFLAMLAATSLAAWWLMLPDDLVAFWRSAREALLARSNRYFARELGSYFAPEATDLPLLHTWSLSIEWQYYAVFAPCFVALLRLVRGKFRLAAMLGLTAVFAALSLFEVAQPGGAYFSAAARAFEFTLGASLALAPPSAVSRNLANALVVLALAGLALFAISFSPTMRYPGGNAFMVSLATALVVRYGAASSLLSAPWIVYVGKRSYSIYLWHWPIIAFAGYVQWRSAHTLAVNLALLVPIVAVAELCYRFVEQPGLRLRIKVVPTFALMVALPLALVVATLPMLRAAEGFPGRLTPEAERIFATLKKAARDREHCNDLPRGANLEACAFGDVSSQTRALLLGDSHAQHYWALVDALAKDGKVKVYGSTHGECLALDGVALVRGGLPYERCSEAARDHYASISSGRYRYVILAQRWIGYPESELERLETSVAKIVASGAIPVILRPVAENGRNASKCFFRHVKLRGPYAGDCAIERDNDFAADKKRYVDALFARVLQRNPTLRLVDVQDVQCDARQCAIEIDGVPIYSDLHHLNDYGAERMAQRLLARSANPLAGPVR